MSRSKVANIALGVLCGPILCCWIAFASCCCPGRLHRHGESEDRKRFERRQVMSPRPLAVRPPERALTIPVPIPPTERHKNARGKTLNQSRSRLLSLPLELRQMIWRAALGDSTIHMVLKKNKLGHLRCKESRTVDCPLGYNGKTLSRACCWGAVDRANIWQPKGGNGPKHTDGNVLPLLQSCRQIYSEAIEYLYTTNCFSFYDLDCLRYFSCTTLPSRFSLIRTLDIEWCLTWPIYDPVAQSFLLTSPALYPPHDEATWEETWRVIAAMPNLNFIRVSLLYFDGFRDRRCERKMLAPMRKVTRPKVFEVHVSWHGDEHAEDAPFTLIRPVAEDGEGQ